MRRNKKQTMADILDELIVWTCIFIAVAMVVTLWS